ncbi:MAG: PleD family two-component system response regulator [Cyanobacteria bacterium P01_D01_bin.156]
MDIVSKMSYSESTSSILIADDDPVSNLMLSQVLEKDGYQVIVVTDGQAALSACEETLPNIILMDAIMPTMDGFDCCQKLQSKYGQACPPILMITGLNDSESVDRAYDAGAADYVTKPFHWAVLRRRVQRAINSHIDHQKLQHCLTEERSLRQKLKIANQQLERLVTVDGLTNIFNRRHFNNKLEQEWKRLRREKSPLGLILLDIDHFKAYNDTYGHPGGDQCLRQVAEIIKDAGRRPADIVARYGGEEFAMILPNTDLNGVVCVGQTVQERVSLAAIPHATSLVKAHVSVSIGLTTMVPGDLESPQVLIDQADKALYDAKANGRDRIVAYSASQSLTTCHPSR